MLMSLSLRQALENRQLNIVNGLRSLHPFYASVPADAFPKSLRMLIQSLEWPAGYTTTGNNYDYPKDREPGWSDDLQGVTHDENTWYFTQSGILWMFPVERDLNSAVTGTVLFPILGDDGLVGHEPRIFGLTLSQKLKDLGCYHLGDCDYDQGRVYIPVEGSQPPLVVSFMVKNRNINSNAKDVAFLTHQTEAPWCAINPLNGMLYSSNFNIDKQGVSVYRISRSIQDGMKLDFVGKFPLFNSNGSPIVVRRVQGGVFSSQGHLYLVSDLKSGGILGFDMLTGRLSTHIAVDYQPDLSSGTGPIDVLIDAGTDAGLWDSRKNAKEELEGITIWDLDTGQAPGISGQIHLVMIDNLGSGADDLYFKHYKVVHPEDKDKI